MDIDRTPVPVAGADGTGPGPRGGAPPAEGHRR